MKYFVLIPDGMADRKSDVLGGRTPMEAANKPMMDSLCQKSRCGTVLNVPKGMVPESDTANLAILSYDPREYSKGRSPLEAASIGLELAEDDTAIRCNLVTLSDEEGVAYEDRTIIDHSADEISTAEADELVKALNAALPMEGRMLHTGISYRHCLVWKNASPTYDFSRPHDHLGKRIGEYLPKEDNGGAEFLEFMKKGFDVLNHHPVNEARRAKGLRPANSPWLWSPGRKPSLPCFDEKWGVTSAIISAVDLIKGVGFCAKSRVIDVEGATGTYHTNYEGKAEAAINAFRDGCNFIYVHVEGPDECGHRGEYDVKTAAIEKIDSLILKPVYEYLLNCGEPFKILVLPDHPTPCEIRTHSSDPVPFFIYDSENEVKGAPRYTEDECTAMNDYIPEGSTLLDEMIVKG
ncbi:MAG: cofactor-independent phosphoglycerate mutase [Ruminococcaceae bacterium]|nr:cofactor-independent phosphoglycerate mutase [Oscillospiraceae bacterium]